MRGETPSGEFERSIVREITALAQRADRLQALLFAALEQVSSPCTIVDAAGAVVRLNRAARRHTGQGFDLGEGVVDWPDIHRRDDGSMIDPADLPLARSLMHGEVVSCEPVTVQWSSSHTTRLLVSSMPVRDEDGAIIGAIATWPVAENKGTQNGG